MNRILKLRKISVFIIVFFLFIGAVGCFAFAGERKGKQKKKRYIKSKYGIKNLMTLSKDRGKMNKIYKKETDNYFEIKNVIENNKLEVGETTLTIRKKYGDPVIILPDWDGTSKKWIYKPAKESFFSEEKIYLIFNENNELVEYKTKD